MFLILQCVVQLKAMQQWDAGRSDLGNGGEASVYNGPQNVSNNGMQSLIDFGRIEDILDFSVQPTSTTLNQDGPKQRPKLRKKMIATEPVELLELKPNIDKYVNDKQQSSEMGPEKDNKRFQCIHCGRKFARSTHLQRHLRLHTGDKPYVCPICRKRFSRSDYKSAHVLSHRREKVHYCCVCGQTYHDLTTFTNHCYSHDDSEYIRIALKESRPHSEQCVQVVEDEFPAADFEEKIEQISCNAVEEVDNSTTEEEIVCIENPHYSTHCQASFVNSNVVISLGGNKTVLQ